MPTEQQIITIEFAGRLTSAYSFGENAFTVRFDETEHGLNPWRARRCIRGRMLQG